MDAAPQNAEEYKQQFLKLRFFSYRLTDTLKPIIIWRDIQDQSPKLPVNLGNLFSGQTKHWSVRITLQGNMALRNVGASNRNMRFSCSKSRRPNILTEYWNVSLQTCSQRLLLSKVSPARFFLNCWKPG